MAQKLLSRKAKYCRSRQKAPRYFDKRTLRTTPVKPGVKKVTGCPKGSTYTQKKGVGCRTVSGQKLSTQLQTLLYKAGTKACPYPGGKELPKGFPMRKKRKKNPVTKEEITKIMKETGKKVGTAAKNRDISLMKSYDTYKRYWMDEARRIGFSQEAGKIYQKAYKEGYGDVPYTRPNPPKTYSVYVRKGQWHIVKRVPKGVSVFGRGYKTVDQAKKAIQNYLNRN